MKKRTLATALWFFAGWYAGAILAWFLGIDAPVGLLVGIAAGGFVGWDPRNMFWAPSATRRVARARLSATASLPTFEADRLT
jgi:hypothetical protein